MPSAAVKARPFVRRMPQRTCVACGTISGKRELIRIVRGPEGDVRPDPTGKKAGRGAYLCADPACWELALKKKKLDRSLKLTLSAQDIGEISEFARGLPQSETV